MKPYLYGTALVLAALCGPAAAQDVTIRYSNWLPTQHFIHQSIVLPWAEEVERVTEGRVRVSVTPKVVGTVAGQYDVVTDGLADMALVVPGYTPGRFPLIEGLELPFMGEDAARRGPASWRIYEKHIAPTGTFDDVHVVTLFVGNVAQIFTTTAELDSVDDLKGLKLRSPQPMTSELLTLAGAVPVSKPVPEIYELASGGVIDGGLITPETIISFKLDDVLPNVAYLDGGVAATVNTFVINKDTWERISEQDRAAIDAVSGEALATIAGAVHAAETQKAVETLKAGGGKATRFSPEELARLTEIAAPIRASWIAAATKAGLADPAAMLTDYKAEIDGN